MQYGFLKQEHKLFPPIIHVENTNICNLKCIHCPQSDPYKLVENYKPSFMSNEIFYAIVDEMKNYNSVLRFTPDGEPLLPSKFENQLGYAMDAGIKYISLNTNGLLFTPHLSRYICDSPSKFIIEFSLDALYKESYDRIRCGSNYIRVLNNIFTLLDMIKKKRKEENVKVFVSCVEQPELDAYELESFKIFWKDMADEVISRQYVDTKSIMPKKIIRDITQRWPCIVVFTRLVIDWDGNVRFCPDDWRKETIVGNIKEKTIREIWNSDEMKDLRKSHLKKTFEHKTCYGCTDWQVIKWGYTYLDAINKTFGSNL